MERARRADYAGAFLQTFVAGAVALSLHAAGSARAFDCREVRGIHGVLAALGSPDSAGTSSAPRIVPFAFEEEGPPLWLVELELPGSAESFNVGLGKHWRPATRIGHFAGFGAAFPGRGSRSPEDPRQFDDRAVAVGVWAGGGAYWDPSAYIRLGLGVKWTPGRVVLSGHGRGEGILESVASAVYRW